MSFMAVLGWSPTMRAALRLKRKSDQETDECDDGARAIFAEEGLAAVLSRLAPRRIGFLSETSVDGEVIEIAIDLNYSDLVNFSENEFTKAGPGALRGISKVFEDLGDYSPTVWTLT